MQLEYFQLIDRVVEVSTAAREIVTEATVPTTSTIFEGHFPGHPLMPGVLLIEAMAQTAGWLVIAATNFDRMPFLAQVKEAKLRNFVAPGTALRLQANLLHEGSGYAMAKAAISADGKAMCDAELTFRVLAFPSPDFKERMLETARKIAFPLGVPANG